MGWTSWLPVGRDSDVMFRGRRTWEANVNPYYGFQLIKRTHNNGKTGSTEQSELTTEIQGVWPERTFVHPLLCGKCVGWNDQLRTNVSLEMQVLQTLNLRNKCCRRDDKQYESRSSLKRNAVFRAPRRWRLGDGRFWGRKGKWDTGRQRQKLALTGD